MGGRMESFLGAYPRQSYAGSRPFPRSISDGGGGGGGGGGEQTVAHDTLLHVELQNAEDGFVALQRQLQGVKHAFGGVVVRYDPLRRDWNRMRGWHDERLRIQTEIDDQFLRAFRSRGRNSRRKKWPCCHRLQCAGRPVGPPVACRGVGRCLKFRGKTVGGLGHEWSPFIGLRHARSIRTAQRGGGARQMARRQKNAAQRTTKALLSRANSLLPSRRGHQSRHVRRVYIGVGTGVQ